ncbi:MAG: DUF1634 domain-containing protein [Endomicrobiales bacterium]
MTRPRVWTDEELEPVIGYILRAGVAAAAVLVFLGGVEYLSRNAGAVSDYRVFVPAAVPRGLAGILGDALAFNGPGIILLGLLLLIATPLLRVVLYLVAFALQRDITYVAVSALVLAVLLYSIIGHGIG